MDSSKVMDPLLHPPSYSSLNDFCYDILALKELARQGSWRTILDKVTQARKLCLLQKPHEHLIYMAYNVLANAKLRRYGEAADELDTLGNFEDPKYRYESHGSFYQGMCGSMIPFSLRWLHAEMPHRLASRQETIDRLYGLLEFVENKITAIEFKIKTDKHLVGLSNDRPGSETVEEVTEVLEKGVETLETLGRGTETIEKGSEILETVQKCNSSSVPFPFTSSTAEKEGAVVVNPVGIKEGVSPGALDFVPSSPIQQAGLVSGGLDFVGATSIQQQLNGSEVVSVFESLKLDEPSHVDVGAGNLTDGLPVGHDSGHSFRDHHSNSFDEDFGDFVSGMASTGSTTQVQLKFSALATSLRRWQRREELVVNSILRHHLSQKDYVTSMKWLERLLKTKPLDPFLLSRVGYLQLQLGDLNGARTIFSRIEAIVDKGQVPFSSSPEVLKNMIHRNKALQYLVEKDYTAAVREYEEVLDRDPGDVVATNNKALCLMYSRDLLGSIKVLENALERVPVLTLNENVVLNICSMYELAFVNNIETKRTLSSWIVQIAPEDFDLSCTRL
ncbi:hypothetical protein SUGI_0493710 [Cryptomeria japonica]|uniref:uncharacterized protein LOC131045818 n=1 Tax=Cryptomeria japonica TaxID=3369 RepID=UPI002408AF39|nr:uncharacterized protein LOC131045818 [Cryptomeria japonica]GLJ25783.1 hypothetical protein SUGI_0493710 [Cryptomeria japonica]